MAWHWLAVGRVSTYRTNDKGLVCRARVSINRAYTADLDRVACLCTRAMALEICCIVETHKACVAVSWSYSCRLRCRARTRNACGSSITTKKIQDSAYNCERFQLKPRWAGDQAQYACMTERWINHPIQQPASRTSECKDRLLPPRLRFHNPPTYIWQALDGP